MATYTNKCPNCSAGLIFNPATNTFDCDSCNSTFTVEELSHESVEPKNTKSSTSSAVKEAYAQAVEQYNCDNCGAEVICDATMTSTTCVYCHNPVVLTGRVTGDFAPDKIIPFSIDEATAQTKLAAWLKTYKYAKKSFVSQAPGQLKGVYLPFWIASGDLMGKVDTTGIIRKSVRLGDYVNTTTETYRVKRTGKLDFNDLVFKAIDKKSMDIITGVYPFDLKKAEPFTMDYLSGTLAEKRQFEKEAFEATTRTSVRNSLTTNMVNALRQFDSVSSQNVAISDEDTMWEYTLLPVWLFTYDFENNPYYFAMNGQTGKIFGRVPLDSKRARKQTWLTIAAMAILGFLVAVI